MSGSKLDTLLGFLKDEPDDVFTHYAIAMEYVSLNDLKKAIEKLEDVIRRDPNYVPAYQQLGAIYVRQDREDEAVRILEKGCAVARQTGDTHALHEMLDALDEIEEGDN